MTPCRLYLTACAMGLAFGALVTLAVCNRLLMALETAQSGARAPSVPPERGSYPASVPPDAAAASDLCRHKEPDPDAMLAAMPEVKDSWVWAVN